MSDEEKLISYFIEEIKHIGFVLDAQDNIRSSFHFGKSVPFSFHEKYIIEISLFDIVKDIYDIKLTHSYPIYNKEHVIIMLSSNKLKEIAIGNITMYSRLELDTENINDFLEYIISINDIKNHLRKNKIKKINGRLGIKI
jgi:hypothetical protein